MKKQLCATCRFYEPAPSQIRMGWCERFPPVLDPSETNVTRRWKNPEVRETDRCGEWRAK